MAHAQTPPGIEEVVWWVTVGNEPAQLLYTSAGFEVFGVEPCYIKVNDRHFDVAGMILHLR